MSGAINITAPNPIENQAFMKEMRTALKMPFGFPAPVWALEIGAIFLKTETELILKSRRAYPEILLNNGFQFQYPTVAEAIKQLLNN